MQYTYMDLNPPKLKHTLAKIECEFYNLTLEKLAQINQSFGELYQAIESFKKEPFNLYKVLWILLVNKADFGTYNDFFKKIMSEHKSAELASQCIEVLYSIIKNSMPLNVNKKRRDDINKILNQGALGSSCYLEFYDIFAKRYGYTLETFYGLTLRQIELMLKKISEKRNEELAIKASLAGKQLKEQIKYDEISEEQEKSQEDHARAALKRLQQDYSLNKLKGNKNGQ